MGDNYISPASWPPMDEAVESVHVELPDLTVQDKQEVRVHVFRPEIHPAYASF